MLTSYVWWLELGMADEHYNLQSQSHTAMLQVIYQLRNMSYVGIHTVISCSMGMSYLPEIYGWAWGPTTNLLFRIFFKTDCLFDIFLLTEQEFSWNNTTLCLFKTTMLHLQYVNIFIFYHFVLCNMTTTPFDEWCADMESSQLQFFYRWKLWS